MENKITEDNLLYQILNQTKVPTSVLHEVDKPIAVKDWERITCCGAWGWTIDPKTRIRRITGGDIIIIAAGGPTSPGRPARILVIVGRGNYSPAAIKWFVERMEPYTKQSISGIEIPVKTSAIRDVEPPTQSQKFVVRQMKRKAPQTANDTKIAVKPMIKKTAPPAAIPEEVPIPAPTETMVLNLVPENNQPQPVDNQARHEQSMAQYHSVSQRKPHYPVHPEHLRYHPFAVLNQLLPQDKQ